MATQYGAASSLNVTLTGPFASGSGTGGKAASITLALASWKQAASPYSQSVTVDGVTLNSRIDLSPTMEQLESLTESGTMLMAVNASGTVTVYAFGAKPSKDLVLQAALFDVTGTGGTIYGNPVGAYTAPVESVNGKTGAVVLAAADVGAVADSNGAVESSHISDAAVTESKIASGAVTEDKIASAVKSSTDTVSIAASAWSSKEATVSVAGVTASNTVICSPIEGSYAQWTENGVRCKAQAAGTLTFRCEETPTLDIVVNVCCINL